jgi:DNA polymerase-3 subunit alpha
MPDIDIDIQDNRRDEVIRYVAHKYGEERVANIVTFGKMAARNAIRDVARTLEVPYAEADRLAKLVPPPQQGRHIPLAVSIKSNPILREEYESNEQSKRIIDLAVQLEGTIRSHGVHAAGVVIAPDDIVKFTPLEMAQKGVVATQYSMGPIEDIGLLKMDFLGLSNLTTIKNTLRIVKKVYKKIIDIDTIPLDDKATYELMSRGDTTGVFQLESAGMKRYLKDLKPTEFDDIIAMCALYRPGPLKAGLVDMFIRRKNGLEAVKTPHPKFDDALASTYGTLVYQEQVMQISKDVCGFSGGEADTLRKAIGKKIREAMQKMEVLFVEGGVKHGGVPRPIMAKFWQELLGFADYAFNKSHSACYAMIAYQTAYLKANFPDAFMASLMTTNYNDTDRLAHDISECRLMGLEVLRPDINESFGEFAVVPNKKQIRFGLLAIKNIGQGPVDHILKVREGKPFESLIDFVSRVDTRIVNKKALESLIKTGAFDQFGIGRKQLLFNIDTIVGFSAKHHRELENGQANLFGDGSDRATVSVLQLEDDFSGNEDNYDLQWERDLLGVYVSSHPLADYQLFFHDNVTAISTLRDSLDGRRVEIGGMVASLKEITTKNGQVMAFATVEDLSGSIEVIIFPGIYKDNKDHFRQDNVVLVGGKLSAKDKDGKASQELKILVDDFELLTPEKIQDKTFVDRIVKPARPSGQNSHALRSKNMPRLYIKVNDPEDYDSLLKLKKTLNKYPGSTEAILVFGDQDKRSAIKLPFKVDAASGLQKELVGFLSAEAVVIK